MDYEIRTKDGRISCTELTRAITGVPSRQKTINEALYRDIKELVKKHGFIPSSQHYKVK